MRISACLGLLLAVCGCARSGAPLAAAPAGFGGGGNDQAGPAAADMAGVYASLCLDAFPDRAAEAQALQGYGADPLGVSQLQAILHADPGRGWRIATPAAHYIVTLEDPPFNTCAVRRMTRSGLPTALPYIAAVNAYAGQHGLSVAKPMKLNQQTPTGASVQALVSPLLAGGNPKPVENSLYISTDYHGQFDPTTTPEAAGGVGVEVRMAHQIVPVRQE